MTQPPEIERRLAELLASAQRHYGLGPAELAVDYQEHRHTGEAQTGGYGDPLWPILRGLVITRYLPVSYDDERRRHRDERVSAGLAQVHTLLSDWAALPEEER